MIALDARKRAALAVALLCCLSCTIQAADEAPAESEGADELAAANAQVDSGWPVGVDELATTSGEIYLGNLNAQIDALTAQIERTSTAVLKPRLATLLYHRFQVEGRLGDAERALALMEQADTADALKPANRLTYARILLGFHHFEAAKREIAAAQANDKSAGATPAAIDDTLGAVERALRLPTGGVPDEVPQTYIAAVERAALHVDRGELAKATELLRLAQERYPDTSPFPLAWIHVQQGIAFLRFGDYEAARTFFAAAHARMPDYFLAAEHLAETEGLLGHARRSAELYREVVAQNGQPAFWHGLAGAEAAQGNKEAAVEAARRAAAGYDALLARHPLMYADHAVDYYLDTDRPGRALELAQMNFQARQDVSARLALIGALEANGQFEDVCTQIEAIRAAGLEPPELTIPDSASSRCR